MFDITYSVYFKAIIKLKAYNIYMKWIKPLQFQSLYKQNNLKILFKIEVGLVSKLHILQVIFEFSYFFSIYINSSTLWILMRKIIWKKRQIWYKIHLLKNLI